MKKYLAILLTVLLLINVTAICALADPADEGNPPASDSTGENTGDTTESTGDSTSSEDTDSTTSTDGTTESTGTTQTAFEVTDIVLTYTDTMVSITYSATGNAVPNAVTVAGHTVNASSEPGRLTIPMTNLPYGTHSVTLAFAEGVVTTGDKYTRGGHVDTLMQIESDGDTVYAIVYDNTDFKLPVVGATVGITVDGREYNAQKTNGDGRATFSGVLPTGKTVTVTCKFATQTIGTVTYNGQTGSKQFTNAANTDSSSSTTTTTTAVGLPTGGGETAVTYPTLDGSLTTSAAAGGVLTDVIIDTHLLAQFGINDAASWNGKARLLIPSERYEQLATAYGASIYGKLTALDTMVDGDMIKEATDGQLSLKQADIDEAVVLPFTFTLQAVSNSTDENISSDFTGTAYTLTLPVPTTMGEATVFAVAMAGSNGLYDLQTVTAANGCVTFQVSSLDHFVLIGFANADGSAAIVDNGEEANPLTGWVVALYIIGILLILGAVALLVWPYVRDRFFPPVAAEDDGVLIYGVEPEEPEQPESDEIPAIIPPIVEDFPGVLPVEDGDPVSDVSLGDFGEE